jgi:Fur family transcriptional regulator, ferric uptake regulator
MTGYRRAACATYHAFIYHYFIDVTLSIFIVFGLTFILLYLCGHRLNPLLTMNQVQTLLKQYDLRHTDCRQAVIEAFLQSAHALAHADVEETVGKAHDRVTVYRTLRTFLEKGVIHKVLDDLAYPKYALCKSPCDTHHHHHAHVHFKCNQCGQTNCLDEVNIPVLTLPKGYVSAETNLLISGTCVDCSAIA